MTFAHQFLTLRHAEPVLLVDNYQTEFLAPEAGFDQSMGANGYHRREFCGLAGRVAGVLWPEVTNSTAMFSG